MPIDDENEDVWTPSGSLSPDGKVESGAPSRKREQTAPAHLPATDQPLELDYSERFAQPEVETPPEERSGGPRQAKKALVLGAVVLAACAGLLFVLLRHAATPPVPAPAGSTLEKLSVPDDPEGALSLTVQSEPAGATVFVENEEIGRTPLLGTNQYARGSQVKVRLELNGYRPWTGTFAGGTNAIVRARLEHK
jgi:hypothetical protein